MIPSLLIILATLIMIVAIFFTLLLLSKQPKNLWMLIPSVVLGLVFAYLTTDDFDSDWTSYVLVFPLVMFCILGLLYNIVPQSSEEPNPQK